MAPQYFLEFDGGEQRVMITRTVVIGRSNIGDVVLAHSTISQVHCRILVEGDAIAIEDSASANGTVVNGMRIRGRVGLKAGDQILIGPYLLRIGSTEAAPAAPTPQARSFAIEVAKLDGASDPAALDANAFQDSVQAAGRVLVIFAGNLRAHERRAEILAELHKSLRDSTARDLRPGQVVATLNDLLLARQVQATGVCLRLDAAERRLHCACAAHHPPWLARSGGRAILVESSPSLEIGRLKSPRYTTESFQLEVDECAVAVSEGFPQLIGGGETEAGLQQIAEIVGRSPTSASAVAGRLRGVLQQRAGAMRPTPASWAICLGLQAV